MIIGMSFDAIVGLSLFFFAAGMMAAAAIIYKFHYRSNKP